MFSSVSASMSGLYLGGSSTADSEVVLDLDALVGVFDMNDLEGVLIGVLIGVLGLLPDNAVVVVGVLEEEDVAVVKALLLEEDAVVIVG